jgi:hypothetical protein
MGAGAPAAGPGAAPNAAPRSQGWRGVCKLCIQVVHNGGWGSGAWRCSEGASVAGPLARARPPPHAHGRHARRHGDLDRRGARAVAAAVPVAASRRRSCCRARRCTCCCARRRARRRERCALLLLLRPRGARLRADLPAAGRARRRPPDRLVPVVRSGSGGGGAVGWEGTPTRRAAHGARARPVQRAGQHSTNHPGPSHDPAPLPASHHLSFCVIPLYQSASMPLLLISGSGHSDVWMRIAPPRWMRQGCFPSNAALAGVEGGGRGDGGGVDWVGCGLGGRLAGGAGGQGTPPAGPAAAQARGGASGGQAPAPLTAHGCARRAARARSAGRTPG